MLPKSVLHHGTEEPVPERIELHAGPLGMVYENGDLRYIKLGDREVIRRIYVAIRDRNWGTVQPVFSNVNLDIDTDSFKITYDVENKQAEIDFAWQAEIIGEANGTLHFRMDGIARSTFWRNRIGFCVLHPAFLAGQRCLLEYDDSSRHEAQLPMMISPDQPVKSFTNLKAMTHEVIPGVWAEVRYSGDIFEVEDQRNWTDASFKTFSTPLRLPYPVEIPQGTRVSQSVTLVLRGEGSGSPVGKVSVNTSRPLTFSIDSMATALPMPPIGLGMASHKQPLEQDELRRLSSLNLGHLRVDLYLNDPEFPATLMRAWTEAKNLGLPLETAVMISPAGDDELSQLHNALNKIQPRILRWLIYPDKEEFWGGSPTGEVLAKAHSHLGSYQKGIPFCSGTNADLIFMQRSMPPLDQIDAITFAIIAEMHASDEASVTETLDAQPMVVKTATELAQGKPIIVSPVTFKLRHNPYTTGPWPVIMPGELPPMVQPRQMSLFAAGWILGSIKSLAGSGAHSLTYFETSGWRGIMEQPGGSPLPEKFHSLPGSVFPMYHIFAYVGEFAGGHVIPTRSSDNLRVEGIALRKNGRMRVIVANMTTETQNVLIEGLSPDLIMFKLDETNVLEAMTTPEDFRESPGNKVKPKAGKLELELLPYGIVRLDSN